MGQKSEILYKRKTVKTAIKPMLGRNPCLLPVGIEGHWLFYSGGGYGSKNKTRLQGLFYL